MTRFLALPKTFETKLRILHGIDRPIEEMTVEDICANSGVSRKTFYAHFDSKYGIAYWYISLAEQLLLSELKETRSWEEGLFDFFSFLYMEKNHLCLAFAENPRDEEVLPRLAQRREALIEVLETQGVVADDSLSFCIEFFIEASNNLIVDWCLECMPTSPRQFTTHFMHCTPSLLAKIVTDKKRR